MKTIIIYHTRSGHTEAVASELKKGLGSGGGPVELKKVELKKGKLGWLRSGFSGGRQKDLPLATDGIDLSGYDRVIVGAPVWSWKGCPVIKTYLASCGGVKGKRIFAFWSCDSNPGKSQEVLAGQVKEMGGQLSQAHMVMENRFSPQQRTAALDDFIKAVK